MNGDWTPWGKQPEELIEKFRLVADLAHRLAPNVATVWCPNHTPEDYDLYYPGDEYVDWVGVNFYSDYYMSGNASLPATTQATFQAGKTSNPMDKLDKIYEMYADRKPIMIGECGVSSYSVTTGEDVLAWGENQLAQLYGYLPLKYPRVKAVFYFSVDQADPGYKPANKWSDYSLARQEMKSEYVDLTGSQYFIPGSSRDSQVRYAHLDEAGLVEGANTLEAYVRVPYPFAGRVQYLLDGRVVAESTRIPFPVTLNVSAGSHTLVLKTWYADGKEGPSRTYRLQVGGAPATEPHFPDTQGHWAFAEIEALAGKNLIGGYEDGTFRPDNQTSH